jgi:hypothetical protein
MSDPYRDPPPRRRLCRREPLHPDLCPLWLAVFVTEIVLLASLVR